MKIITTEQYNNYLKLGWKLNQTTYRNKRFDWMADEGIIALEKAKRKQKTYKDYVAYKTKHGWKIFSKQSFYLCVNLNKTHTFKQFCQKEEEEQRAFKPKRLLTKSEIALITAMAEQGLKITHIAKELNISYSILKREFSHTNLFNKNKKWN